tara:strand:+ start:275 stop:454 length:180 start_codon:yes stop_codon:yes gene_type:complete
LALKDQEVTQVPQVLLVELVHKDLKVIPGLQDLKEPKVILGPRVQLVEQDLRDLEVILD